MSETPRTKASQAFNPTINASSLEGMRAALFDITIPEVNEAITRLERELAAERERADRNEQDAERWRFARDDYKNFAIMQNIGHDWTRLEPSEANAAIDAARKP